MALAVYALVSAENVSEIPVVKKTTNETANPDNSSDILFAEDSDEDESAASVYKVDPRKKVIKRSSKSRTAGKDNENYKRGGSELTVSGDTMMQIPDTKEEMTELRKQKYISHANKSSNRAINYVGPQCGLDKYDIEELEKIFAERNEKVIELRGVLADDKEELERQTTQILDEYWEQVERVLDPDKFPKFKQLFSQRDPIRPRSRSKRSSRISRNKINVPDFKDKVEDLRSDMPNPPPPPKELKVPDPPLNEVETR